MPILKSLKSSLSNSKKKTRPTINRDGSSSTSSSSSGSPPNVNTKVNLSSSLVKGGEYDLANLYDSLVNHNPYHNPSMAKCSKIGLRMVGELLRKGVNLKYNFAIGKEGFFANDAVDYMVNVGLATSPRDAVCIGLALEKELDFIENIKGPEHFGDARLLFSFTTDKNASSSWKDELEAVRYWFERHVRLTDHVYRLKTYRKTFTGTEGVDLILRGGMTSARSDAVLLGRALMAEYQLFRHVTLEHEFDDKEVFFVMC